jgi:hypothetical protein
MRYRNWDVLLFPEGSKVPIQEFKTQCFVTKDKDSPYLHSTAFLGSHAHHPEQGAFNQLPVLTTFIPSLSKDSPFQASVHSWEKPRPSVQIESNMEPEDVLLFEVRIFIDGVFAAWVFYDICTLMMGLGWFLPGAVSMDRELLGHRLWVSCARVYIVAYIVGTQFQGSRNFLCLVFYLLNSYWHLFGRSEL